MVCIFALVVSVACSSRTAKCWSSVSFCRSYWCVACIYTTMNQCSPVRPSQLTSACTCKTFYSMAYVCSQSSDWLILGHSFEMPSGTKANTCHRRYPTAFSKMTLETQSVLTIFFAHLLLFGLHDSEASIAFKCCMAHSVLWPKLGI